MAYALIFEGDYTDNGKKHEEIWKIKGTEENLRLRKGLTVSADMGNITQLF